MKILQSARKHGLTDDEIISAYNHPVYSATERKDPLKVLLIGITTTYKTVELCYTTRNSEIIIFHAMTCNKATLNRIKKATRR